MWQDKLERAEIAQTVEALGDHFQVRPFMRTVVLLASVWLNCIKTAYVLGPVSGAGSCTRQGTLVVCDRLYQQRVMRCCVCSGQRGCLAVLTEMNTGQNRGFDFGSHEYKSIRLSNDYISSKILEYCRTTSSIVSNKHR